MLKENKDDIEDFLLNYSNEIKTLLQTNHTQFKIKDTVILVEMTQGAILDKDKYEEK